MKEIWKDIKWYEEEIQGWIPRRWLFVYWHPVMIWDVLKRWNWQTTVMTLTQWVRRYLDKPIDDQSDECIDYIVSLIDKYKYEK